MIGERILSLLGIEARGHVLGDGDNVWAGAMRTASGERVSPETAQKVSAFYAAVWIICAAGIRQMPLRVVREAPGGVMKPERGTRLWELLHDRPNDDMHAADLWEWCGQALIMRGNAYLWLVRDSAGRVQQLRTLNPSRVSVGRDPRTRRKIFAVHAPDERENVEFVGTTSDILHIRGRGSDPLVGVSMIHYLAETLGRALAEDRHSATQMKNQGRPSGVLSVEGKLDDERAERLAARWNAAHGGASKAGRTAVLEDGAKWEPITVSASDMELVAQRDFTRQDIAIAFAMPADMFITGNQIGLHYSSDASRDVRLLKYAIMPWAVRIQSGLEICDLMPWEAESAGGRLYPRFNPAGLLLADIATRYKAHRDGIEGGFLTPNEARQVEDREPVPGGDRLRVLDKPPAQQTT